MPFFFFFFSVHTILPVYNSQKHSQNFKKNSQKRELENWKTLAKTMLISKCPRTSNDYRLGNPSCTHAYTLFIPAFFP